MSYDILVLRHSGAGLIGNTSTSSQYDCPMVAARAISGGDLVCFGPAAWSLSSPGLPLSAASPKPSRVATGTRTQSRVHRNPAAQVDSSGASSLSAAGAAHQLRRGAGVKAVVRTKLCSWLRAISTASSNASFNIIRIVAPQPSWRRCTQCWHPPQGTTLSRN